MTKSQTASWVFEFDCADYANNFNDMFSGFVTLFELLVVNNWFEIVDGFVMVGAMCTHARTHTHMRRISH